MKIGNIQAYSKDLFNKSVITVGRAGTGKTSLMQSMLGKYVKEGLCVGIMCTIEHAASYARVLKAMEVSHSIKFYLMSEPLYIGDAQSIALEVDVLFIDDADFIIGNGDHLNEFLNWWEGIIPIIAYQTFDAISTAPVYLESTMNRFDNKVLFKNNRTFVTNVLLGRDIASDVDRLECGEVIVFDSFSELSEQQNIIRG